ncbi:MAG: pyridoxamine 5'-phosphate oxidase family protein [Actinomycetes bacterium]
MSVDPHAPPPEVRAFLAERHLAILTTVEPDGRLHACAVGFTYDPDTATARVITGRRSRKARNAAAGCRAVVGQVDGPRWLSLEGTAALTTDPEAVAAGERRYAERYREPRPNPDRAVIEIAVTRILGRAASTPGRSA